MRTVESLADLLMYLYEAGVISRDHYDEQTRLLKCYAMRLDLKGDTNGPDRSYREARARLFPSKYFLGAHKNTLNVFGHIGVHGIPVAVGQMLVYLLGEPLFDDIMRVVYGFETPTPYSLQFKCLGVDGKGCRCKSGFDRDTAKVSFVMGDYPEHPMFGRFLCEHCRASEAFDTTTLKILKQHRPLTEYQQDLLERTESRLGTRRVQRLEHYHANVSGSAAEVTRHRNLQERTNLNREARDARAGRAAQNYQKNLAANNKKKKALRKYSMDQYVKYPSELFRHMCKALKLYIQQRGSKALHTTKVNNILRAVLIRYNHDFPNDRVIEYYVHDRDGKYRPVYFTLEFNAVIENYMSKTDRDGNARKNGMLWFCKNDVITDEEIERVKRESGRVPDSVLIESVVQQTFDNIGDFVSPRNPAPNQHRLQDTAANYTPKNSAWLPFTRGVDLAWD